jgi:SAM-dependent methyltransferase
VISEIELEHIRDDLICNSSISNILIAGGGKISGGSELIFLHAFDSKVNCVSVDINRKRNPDLIVDLMCCWPFQNEIFDLVISTWVLEHVSNPENCFCEAKRVLSEKGAFVCAVPFIQRKHGSPHDYYRFTDTALSALAICAGFKQVEIKPVGGGPFLCCLSLIWSLIRLPFLGFLFFLVSLALDELLVVVTYSLGKGYELIRSYPINYILIARK